MSIRRLKFIWRHFSKETGAPRLASLAFDGFTMVDQERLSVLEVLLCTGRALRILVLGIALRFCTLIDH